MPFNDALDKILGNAFGAPEARPYARATIVRAVSRERADHQLWRCLVCLAGGSGDFESVSLGVEVHLLTCQGDPLLAAARADLLEAISDASAAAFASSWHDGVEKILLLRGGMWALLADRLGWPYGLDGVIEWDSDLDAALARYGCTRADLDAQFPREG